MTYIERRQKLLCLLSDRETITLGTLENILNVRKRTIKNDIDILSRTYSIIVRGRYSGGIKLNKEIYRRRYLNSKQYNLLVSLSCLLDSEDYIIMQSIINNFTLI